MIPEATVRRWLADIIDAQGASLPASPGETCEDLAERAAELARERGRFWQEWRLSHSEPDSLLFTRKSSEGGQ